MFTGFMDFQILPDIAAYPNCCGRQYSGTFSIRNLRKHLKLECNIEPKFSCAVCLRRFSRNENLKRHLARMH